MKVALVLFDWFAHGGLQRDCRRIGESLSDRGADVDVLCMSRDGEVPPALHCIEAPAMNSSKVTSRKAFARFVAQQRDANAYDVVVGFNRLPGLDYYFAADTCFAWKAARERHLFYRWAPRSRQYLAFEQAVFGPGSKTRVFMLSPMQKAEYLACYPQCEVRLLDVPPGIARDRMAPADADTVRQHWRCEFGLSESDLVVLQVGTGYPVKGVDRSLAAIAALPEALRSRVQFFLLGSDPRYRYATEAARLGMAAQLHILAGRDDLPRFYQGADLLLQPSQKESAGMVLLESIVAGLPVLTTATCGYAFHVEQAQAGVVLPEPFTQQSMNDALASILAADKSAWREHGIAYGRQGDFYAMPDHVAQIILAGHGAKAHGH